VGSNPTLTAKGYDMSIENDIKNWISFISARQEAISGFPVCPYASRAKYEIVSDGSLYSGVKHALDVLKETDKDIVILDLSEENYTPDDLEKEIDSYNKNLKAEDIWLLLDHPEVVTDINGVPTSNGKHVLVLVQRLSDLNSASDHLKQNTKYYSSWSKEYYYKIVRSRE
jgi:hypothetical protein